MADILPSSPDLSDAGGDEPLVVGIDSERTEDLLAAISSDTARHILAALHEDPAAASELANRVDTSIQNVQYHLEKLDDAGLVDRAGTAYSEKGREMAVYAPADRALVVVAGPEEETDTLTTALKRLLGGVGALAFGSLVVERLLGRGATFMGQPLGGMGGAAGGAPTDTATPEPGVAATETEAKADQATATATPTPEATPTEATTPTPTEAATPTPTAGATGTPTAGATETPMATGTPTATPAATPTATPEPTATEVATQTARETATAVSTTAVPGGGVAPGPLDLLASSPGALFFLGGFVVLLAVVFVSVSR